MQILVVVSLRLWLLLSQHRHQHISSPATDRSALDSTRKHQKQSRKKIESLNRRKTSDNSKLQNDLVRQSSYLAQESRPHVRIQFRTFPSLFLVPHSARLSCRLGNLCPIMPIMPIHSESPIRRFPYPRIALIARIAPQLHHIPQEIYTYPLALVDASVGWPPPCIIWSALRLLLFVLLLSYPALARFLALLASQPPLATALELHLLGSLDAFSSSALGLDLPGTVYPHLRPMHGLVRHCSRVESLLGFNTW